LATAHAVEDDFRYCEKLARHHYENFSVLSRFIPPLLRPHFSAVYAFCRGVDDLGDEYQGDRRLALAEWRTELQRCYAGRPQHPVFRALSDTVRRFQLPYDEFDKLIRANEMDQEGQRYQTYAEVREYCRHSADPVGHLVLGLFGLADERRCQWSDATCTALQLTNFWQDTVRDLAVGRHYWPTEDLQRFGLWPNQLEQWARNGGWQSAEERLSAWGRFEAQRIEELFRQGAELEHHVPPRLAMQLQLYRLGGQAITAAMAKQQFNPFRGRPTVRVSQKMYIMGHVAVRWMRHPTADR
jgi:squalene synthase HpnC